MIATGLYSAVIEACRLVEEVTGPVARWAYTRLVRAESRRLS